MKKTVAFLFVIIMVLNVVGCSAAENKPQNTIILKIDSPIMTVNGKEMAIDNSNTSPVIENGRTLVPIRAIIEAIGGGVLWEEDTQNVVIALDETIIALTIDDKTAFVNSTKSELDVAPKIINSRTMMPIRFISENLGFNVEWQEKEQKIIITK